VPLVNRGGSSLSADLGGAEDAGAEDDEPDDGVEDPAVGPDAGGVCTAFGSRVSRGGASVSAIPTGAVEAFTIGLSCVVPVGCHAPVPSQGI
jgi:hypothetical protein